MSRAKASSKLRPQAISIPIVKHLAMGQDIMAECDGSTYGSGTMEKLNSKGVAGLKSLPNQYLHRRLAETWTPAMAERADRIKMPWCAVVTMLSFEPTAGEVAAAKSDPSAAAALAQRQACRDKFLDMFEHGVRGSEFERAVRLWKSQNSELWSKGQRRNMIKEQKEAMRRGLREVVNAAKAMVNTMNTLPDTKNKVEAVKFIERCEEVVRAAVQVCNDTFL